MQIPSRDDIRDICTEQSFQRGRTYYQQGRIQQLDVEDGVARATVRGTHDYEVTADLTDDRIETECTCPYDYAGDCKHVVAVLLAVSEGEYGGAEARASSDADAASDGLAEPTDVRDVIDRTSPDVLREFLADLVESDRDVRDRFLAFTGADVDTSVYDYKAEIDRKFDDAAGRGGMIEWDTRLDFSKYDDLAESRRSAGDYETAAEIHRAVAETVRENLGRVDDSSGHYGQRIAESVEAYAECIAEGTSGHEERREHVEYLFEQFVEAEYSFVSGYYDDAIHELCTTTEDREYWRELLAPHVADATGVDIADPEWSGADREASRSGDRTNSDGTSDGSDGVSDESDETEESSEGPTAGQQLVATDLATGPLDVDDFTGGTLDVEHLAEGPLEVELFVGDAFDHLPAVVAPSDAVGASDEPSDAGTGNETTGSASATAESGSGVPSATVGAVGTASVRRKTLVSSALALLEDLDDREATLALLDEVFLDRSSFCERYADLLLEAGEKERAIEVLEAGVDEFRSATSLRRRLVDLYRGRDADRYRHHLRELVVRDRDWAAYDDLRAACPDEEWPMVREEVVSRLDRSGGTDVVDLYLHEGEREAAFELVLHRGGLGVLDRYASRVGDVDPERYFEAYAGEVAPFLANETGRRHYREAIGHLESMQELGLDDRLAEFVADLKDEHANRPAFLDELEKAGF